MASMTEAEIQETLRDFLIHEFPRHARAIAQVSADDSLVDLGLLDSLGLLTLVTFVELKWNVKIAPKDFTPESFKSLNRIAATLGRYR
jgi:acyl carrier protein